MCKLISLSYYFNILEVGFVVLGGLMLVGMILKQQKKDGIIAQNYGWGFTIN